MSDSLVDPVPRFHRRSLVLRNERREVPRLAEEVEKFGLECGLSTDDTSHVNLALDELVINVIKYAYDDRQDHLIHVTLLMDGDELTIVVEDDGRAFNPLAAPPPNLDAPIEQRPIGGLGIFLVKSIADSLDYRREGGRNILTLRKRVARGAGASG